MTTYISNLPVFTKTELLLVISNFFMLTAWYYHLKHLNDKPWYIAAIVSWGIAFFEYSVHIPANRIGHAELTNSCTAADITGWHVTDHVYSVHHLHDESSD